jgi:ABC-2 type transport system permease protein
VRDPVRALAGALALMRAELADFLQYRVVMFLYALWDIVSPIIYLAVWSVVAGDGTVGGYGQGDFVAYYLVFMAVTHLTAAIEVYTFGPMIQYGRLSPHLLRPMHPIWVAVARNLAYKAVSMLFLLPIWAVLFVVLRPPFEVDALAIGLFVPALALAGLVSFLSGTCFALLAFWTTRSFSFWEIWTGLTFLLGGQVAPVAVLPGVVQTLAVALPMRYTLGFPIEVLLGRVRGLDLVVGFALQVGWTLAAGAAVALIWRAGIKRYAAVGA